MFPCCDVPKTHLKVFYCNQNLNYCVQLFYQKHDEDFSLHFLDFTAFPSGLSHVMPSKKSERVRVTGYIRDSLA